MISRDNVITVSRGETFTIDKVLKNNDGTAYVLPGFVGQSQHIENPYFVITISSQAYSKIDDFRRNYYCRYNGPKFKITRPQELIVDGEVQTEFTDVNATAVAVDGYDIDGSDPCVFYIHGHPEQCKYVKKIVNGNLTSYVWQDYELSLTVSFINHETSQWVEGNYVWSINFVAGEAIFPDGSNVPVYSNLTHAIPIMKATSLKVVSPLINLKGGIL